MTEKGAIQVPESQQIRDALQHIADRRDSAMRHLDARIAELQREREALLEIGETPVIQFTPTRPEPGNSINHF